MKVTLAKALVVKNRFIQQINELKPKIVRANSSAVLGTIEKPPTEGKFDYDINKLIDQYIETTKKLMDTKVAISLANKDEKQQRRIFGLSELKSQIAMLKEIPSNTGTSAGDRYGNNSNAVTTTFVQIDTDAKEKMINDIQRVLDETQEEVEKFNWKTEVEIPEL